MSSTLLRFPDIEDLNRDGQVSLGERASATFTLCAGVWLFLQVLYIGGCLLAGEKGEMCPTLTRLSRSIKQD